MQTYGLLVQAQTTAEIRQRKSQWHSHTRKLKCHDDVHIALKMNLQIQSISARWPRRKRLLLLVACLCEPINQRPRADAVKRDSSSTVVTLINNTDPVVIK